MRGETGAEGESGDEVRHLRGPFVRGTLRRQLI